MKALSVLMVENSPDDALLIKDELHRGGYELVTERVDTPETMIEALKRKSWDIVLSDFQLPRFSGFVALEILKESGIELPFIIVSGKIVEETAIAMMKNGANDYVMKDNLSRLVPAVARELEDFEIKRRTKEAERQRDSLMLELERRVNELNVLHKTALLLQTATWEISSLLNHITTILPEGLRFHDQVAVRVTYGNQEANSANYMHTQWCHRIQFRTSDGVPGTVEICYLQPAPECAECYFLVEEMQTIQSVSDMLQGYLERQVAERQRLATDIRLRQCLEDAICAIAETAELRDKYTAGHQRKSAQLATRLGRKLGMPKSQLEGLHLAGLVHDIGQSFSRDISSTDPDLSEFATVINRTHPQIGHDILKSVDFPWPIAKIVLQHHERFDGSGYPHALKGDLILPEARILAVADTVEALTFGNLNGPEEGMSMAMQEIKRNRGTLYDPLVVDACIALFKEDGFVFESTGPEDGNEFPVLNLAQSNLPASNLNPVFNPF